MKRTIHSFPPRTFDFFFPSPIVNFHLQTSQQKKKSIKKNFFFFFVGSSTQQADGNIKRRPLRKITRHQTHTARARTQQHTNCVVSAQRARRQARVSVSATA